MNLTERLRTVAERLRSSLWFLPTVAVVVASALAFTLVRWEVGEDDLLSPFVFGGGVAGARAVLQVVTGSVMTVVSVTFSITVVALVNASNQYSPRVLRTFLRDRAQQVMLSVFLATFAYGIVVLRTVPAETDPRSVTIGVPRLAVTVAVLLAFASLAALVHFIHHITRSLRVESILHEVTSDTLSAVPFVHPPNARTGAAIADPPVGATRIVATSSGYIQRYVPSPALPTARDADVVVRYRHATGEHVTTGSVVAFAWSHRGDNEVDGGEIADAVNASMVLETGRTMDQDVAYGVRQLTDIALRALSPGINDPTTAADAMAQLSVVLTKLVRGGDLGPWLFCDDAEVPRVLVPARGLADHLEVVIPQVLLYGAQDPVVMAALVRMLEDVGAATRAVAERKVVRAHVRACAAVAAERITGDTGRSLVAHTVNDALNLLDRIPTDPPVPHVH